MVYFFLKKNALFILRPKGRGALCVCSGAVSVLKAEGIISSFDLRTLRPPLLRVVLILYKGQNMKKFIILILTALTVNACTSLTRSEQIQLQYLKGKGVTIDHPVGSFEKPKSSVAAGALNIFPGFGNFYLAMGNGSDSSHALYGFLNLLFWPLAIVWSIPEAAIDADNLNKREMLYYYKYDPIGIKDARQAGITFE